MTDGPGQLRTQGQAPPRQQQSPSSTPMLDKDILVSSATTVLAPSGITDSPVVATTTTPIALKRHLNSNPKSNSRSFPFLTYVPPVHTNRTLVLCFDGTGDQFSHKNSNVVELFSMLKKDDTTKQMVYYQAGIGTYLAPQVEAKWHRRLTQALDYLIAHSLDTHVMQGYEFLMKNHTDGDRICLFGFSRGAYTARALAGMLHKVGLLPADNLQQVPFAYKLYRDTSEEGWRQSNKFKRAFSLDVDIHFLGVWDTVDAVGIVPRRLPFTTSNTIVRTFRQALALDECRANFKANSWNYPSEQESKLGPQRVTQEDGDDRLAWLNVRETTDSVVNVDWDGTAEIDAAERMYAAVRPRKTDVYEVWFAGCHCDVGGGSVSSQTPHSLSRIPLRWMIKETFKTNTGIMFSSERLRRIGLDPSALYRGARERLPGAVLGDREGRQEFDGVQATGSVNRGLVEGKEEEEDLRDAMMPKCDQLRRKPVWWIMELVPMLFRVQKGDGSWHQRRQWNLGKGRVIPRQQDVGVNMHRTVKTRMESYMEPNGRQYSPAASLKVEPRWVD